MNRKRIIRYAIRKIKKKRKKILNYTKKNDNISYQMMDIELSHYIRNVITSARIHWIYFSLDSVKYIAQYMPKDADLKNDFEILKQISFCNKEIDWRKYYNLLVEDYDNIIARFKSELVDVDKNKWTPTDIVALIGGMSGLITTIITATIKAMQ